MFQNREEAGWRLARRLEHLERIPDLLVLALPRGGVAVARPVADALEAELDLLLVRKLGVPGHPELAFGAIALGGARVLNDEIIDALQISADAIERIAQDEDRELRRRALLYRGSFEPPRVAGRVVVVVDDGLATGATVRIAVQALRGARASTVVVAAPVAPPETIDRLGDVADAIICVAMPDPFLSVGTWFEDFEQVSDDDVCELLGRVRGHWLAPTASEVSPR